jgi:hypothetical protein
VSVARGHCERRTVGALTTSRPRRPLTGRRASGAAAPASASEASASPASRGSRAPPGATRLRRHAAAAPRNSEGSRQPAMPMNMLRHMYHGFCSGRAAHEPRRVRKRELVGRATQQLKTRALASLRPQRARGGAATHRRAGRRRAGAKHALAGARSGAQPQGQARQGSGRANAAPARRPRRARSRASRMSPSHAAQYSAAVRPSAWAAERRSRHMRCSTRLKAVH